MSQLKFLLLEDSLLDAELIQAILIEGSVTCELIQAKTRAEFETALQGSCFDLILADYSLPSFDGISALEMAQNFCPNIPFIFVTATLGEELAIETLKKGATDYVLKQRLQRLIPSIMRALREAKERKARQQAEAELHRREQEFRALVENSPDIIARIDKNFRYIYVNPAVEQATGLPPATVTGKTALELGFPEEMYASWEDRLRQVLVTGEGCFLEFDFPSPDGIRYFQARVVPEIAQDGTVESLLSIVRDFTEIKLAEAQLRQQKEELERANNLKDEFLAVLSHELRSPLNAILGWSQLLRQRPPDTGTLKRALETIERNAKLQTQLIEDLLDISRIIRGKLSLRPLPINLVPTIQAAIDTMRLAAEVKAIDLQFSIIEEDEKKNFPQNPENLLTPSSPKFKVLGDSSRLQQVVWNLLSNAIKFTPQGGKVEVLLSSAKSADSAIIQVRDTGIGISKNFLPYVFDSFRQEDGSTTRKYGGLGLGLAIARHLVELHGGTVSADSAGDGQGATFTLKIPIIKENKKSLFGNNPEIADSSQASSDKPFVGINVLVVDDNSDSAEFLVFLLEEYGAMATAAISVSAALDILISLKPDLIISDIGMPDEDGYSFIRQIRVLPPEQGGQTPAIALTAYASERDRQQAMSAGFHRHLSKPVIPEQLVSAVTELIENCYSNYLQKEGNRTAEDAEDTEE